MPDAICATGPRDARPRSRCRPPKAPKKVQFGSIVTIERDDGRRQTWRIVGEDEAEPTKGTLSYASPVARALMSKSVGDVVQAGAGEAEIVEIR